MGEHTEQCPECGRSDRHTRDCFIGLCYERDTLKAAAEALAVALEETVQIIDVLADEGFTVNGKHRERLLKDLKRFRAALHTWRGEG